MTRFVLAELDAVLCIARLGSFTAAALELGISTISLSNAVAELDRWVFACSTARPEASRLPMRERPLWNGLHPR
ncbi:LysR family transcriptional regulator [Asticcacaulis sp. AND118]|nr:LysR family transcriptional regulator [Asticcacaulis sp. AND118]UDF05655.1 LysR family transcriptional regulator [Asticcacaulis sp. AND118]